MSRLRKCRIYLVHCSTGRAVTGSAGKPGMRARCALSLTGGKWERRVSAGRAISVFDAVEGGCLSLKRT